MCNLWCTCMHAVYCISINNLYIHVVVYSKYLEHKMRYWFQEKAIKNSLTLNSRKKSKSFFTIQTGSVPTARNWTGYTERTVCRDKKIFKRLQKTKETQSEFVHMYLFYRQYFKV